MKVLIQRVLNANVKIDGKLINEISKGYLLLVSFTEGDNEEIVNRIAQKICNLRIFEDENSKTNLSLKDVNGEILSISQFTLYADIRKGNRPSFINSLKPDQANILYQKFNQKIREIGFIVKEGVFGADMKINLINDGPFTIMVDSKEIL